MITKWHRFDFIEAHRAIEVVCEANKKEIESVLCLPCCSQRFNIHREHEVKRE